MASLITLLTDFGLTEYVACMKGVIASLAPQAQIIDLTHEVPPFQVAEAAYLIYSSYRYFPKQTIHVIVVDPGVGTARRLLCLDAGAHRFLAPDNGVLTFILGELKAPRLFDISHTPYRLHKVSPTFHGRDILAPCAARLAQGLKPHQLGPPTSRPTLLSLAAQWNPNQHRFEGMILHLDRFGNAVTTITKRVARRHLADRLSQAQVYLPKRHLTIKRLARTYGEVKAPGQPVAVFGSSDFLELAIDQGSFQQRYQVAQGDPVWLRG